MVAIFYAIFTLNITDLVCFIQKIGGLVPTKAWLPHTPSCKKKRMMSPYFFLNYPLNMQIKKTKTDRSITKNFQKTYSLLLFYG